jgi:septation ring formation regulator EzrA
MEQEKEVKKTRGGARANAGRKTVASEQRVNDIFLSALKSLKSVETDDEAKIEFAKDLYTSQRGQIFIAEHLFGKPKETVETTHNINNFDIKDIFKIESNNNK